MLEVHPGFFVGDEADEQRVRGEPGWFFVHACKEPHHRQALGYTGRAAAKDYPEYLIARRNACLILNRVDVTDVNYVAAEIVDAAIEAIHANLGSAKVLLHCNQGQSRSPSIALLTPIDLGAWGAMMLSRRFARSTRPMRRRAEWQTTSD